VQAWLTDAVVAAPARVIVIDALRRPEITLGPEAEPMDLFYLVM
jgi:hypothetical protein